MKFLLTSAGLTNKSISDAALELLELPKEQVKLAFVPTAANPEEGDKDWLIDNLIQFKNQEYQSIDIVEIAALPKSQWLPRLEAANLICFGGGKEQYLAKVINESGLREELPRLLESRVYMGISAGSMVAGHFMSREINKIVYPEDDETGEMHPSLKLVDMIFVPHLNSAYFPQVRNEVLNQLEKMDFPIYAPDDQSAVKIADGKIEVVSEGNIFIS